MTKTIMLIYRSSVSKKKSRNKWTNRIITIKHPSLTFTSYASWLLSKTGTTGGFILNSLLVSADAGEEDHSSRRGSEYWGEELSKKKEEWTGGNLKKRKQCCQIYVCTYEASAPVFHFMFLRCKLAEEETGMKHERMNDMQNE